VGDHHSQVNRVAVPRGAIVRAIGIREQLLCKEVFTREHRHAERGIERSAQFDACLTHDLELDGDSIDLDEGANAVLIRADGTQELER
jgi:hypothetical protein